ncbi:hypothetical protein BDN72DRAFT_830551 [Pluteus cervinus]|uniref:Uncharacterized protein n=1 Tax=Pluteus cervinus TaxID=181527 RepID=A0ACD3BH95_9AGAR|nr:hypothetical protein BDN72DRAFT_830551 [Pluteus cervinus]
MSMANPSATPAGPRPAISERYIDVPSQRLYSLSLGLLCQAIKVFDFFRYLASREDSLSLFRKWVLTDFAYCTILSQLRIPRLHYSKAVVVLQILLLWVLDGVMFGAVTLNMSKGHVGASSAYRQDFPATPEPFNFLDFLRPLSFGLIPPTYDSDGHLLGQHTVRMSPISTAHLNPSFQTYCLGPPTNSVLLPVLLNNTNPIGLRYSSIPLGSDGTAKVEYFDLSGKDLKAIEQARLRHLELLKPATTRSPDDDDYDEYDDDDDDTDASINPRTNLQKTQSLVHIQINKPGFVRLERVIDISNIDARLGYSNGVTVAPCPRVEFVEDTWPDPHVLCTGADQELQVMIDIYGVPPLTLRWSQTTNDKPEHFLVEGIDGGNDNPRAAESAQQPLARHGKPQQVKVPLTISPDVVGTYVYTLQEVSDSVGNVVRVGSDTLSSDAPTSGKTKFTRVLQVLRKPAVSFKQCGPGNPTPLLVGSEAPLTVTANIADSLDAPWEIQLKYQPSVDLEEGAKPDKRFKPWNKVLSTKGDTKDLSVRATAPGEYTILGVKGKYCTGDVLAPESCKVVERPLPTAEIEWKRIHECSGDTGVSASLTLRGTPPFHVTYRVQRDKEPAREYSKTFGSLRGELTLQPERSGHYLFSFVHLSDAHYRKVELKGPSIDQIVHPLAAADFTSGQPGSGRNKRVISSCEGDTVDVDVELRGTGPWNLEVQVIGPKLAETLHFNNIETSQKTLQIPIPKLVNKEGGTFEVDLVSIEDTYKCKRPLSVAGISVNVRRVKPTVKFYGKEKNRRITVLEHDTAELPLRLTGDGPWRVQYRRVDGSGGLMTAVLNSPNDALKVNNKGTYELLEVRDSQCPGSITPDASTYTVDWVPRPAAKLAQNTIATFEPGNGSYILPPICEGISDSVDLELSGRPPFQIMYNIARDSETGGTQLMDQPTFNSIQPRTRFQLQTTNPGRMYYEVKQIGDAVYPLAKHKNAVIARSERLLFEQQVAMRPSAHFKTRDRLSYCLHDSFVPGADANSADAVILFEGTPPFDLRLRIKNIVTSHVETVSISTHESIWKVDVPSYTFSSIGAHLVTIEVVQDSSRCLQAALDPLQSSIWVDVAETAAIFPFDRRQDYCVGDISQFQLEGIPPWTVGYQINGKSYTQEAKVSPFSLLQQQAGEFVVTSIAHQQKKCQAAVTDLHFTIHSLPSAQVGHGKRIYQDIHEGDQAEIVFTLIGEPPFTFTYQRSEPSPKRGGKPGKVLETHTVSRISTNEYSIFSAQEGTWTVTSITDKYCRYPPAQADLSSENVK